jgi:hypothetical protein
VTSRPRLSDQQKRRAARIAREKGLTCPECGSSEPVPEAEARAHLDDGGTDIAMRCVDCESASEVTLVLTPEEAKALGLTRAAGPSGGALRTSHYRERLLPPRSSSS